MKLHVFTSPAAHARLDFVIRQIVALEPSEELLLIGASRAVADEIAFSAAIQRGGLFGVRRSGFIELAVRLAAPLLARDKLSPMSGLGLEALVTRATFTARRDGALEYFKPVAAMPGFPRAAARTLQEVQLTGVPVEALRQDVTAGLDLAELLERVSVDAVAAGGASRAHVLTTAVQALHAAPAGFKSTHVVLIDVAITSAAEREFVAALSDATQSLVAVCPEGDAATRGVCEQLGATFTADPHEAGATALTQLQRYVFSPESPPQRDDDDSVRVFSAPGEGREAVEIARRVLQEAARGVSFDQIAVLLRAPQTYLGLLEHAFSRAGIPAWFERGTRRPDAAGRALLALLACADEQLSARRFAEYLSLGQVPTAATPIHDDWAPPLDESVEAIVPPDDRAEDPAPVDEAPAASERDRDRVIAGTLQAPWRWEELLVEAYVIGGLGRWRKRLPGLRHEYERRIRELSEEEPDSPRIAGLERDRTQLQYLEELALPIVETLDQWTDAQPWAVWLERLTKLVPRVLRQPARVLRALAELAPLGDVGPVTLKEVRDVLTPRLRTLTHEPPRRRHGRVFVGTCHSARGRSFRVVFVPGLAERVFPQRVREDALLLDAKRRVIDASLGTRQTRADEERLLLRVAVGAARERLYVSYPRLELRESRARVPSFYVLDIVRAATGTVPNYSQAAARANREGAALLSWPAPPLPDAAIDDLEHDLAVLHPLLTSRNTPEQAGRARYLVDLNPALRRAVSERWARHQPRWSKADGLINPSAHALSLLNGQRLTMRSYSLTALQRYSICPYQFLLAAIYRLSPLEEPAPLQRMDPLTRGSLFHEIQARFLRTLKQNGQLPVTAARLSTAQDQLRWTIASVADNAAKKLAPAIERVWLDEVEHLRRDLLLWVEELSKETEWIPERFEFAFGLDAIFDEMRDPASVRDPAMIDGRFRLRGSIDLVERHLRTNALRVTDHKTGKYRLQRSAVVNGGQVLQPVLYGLALEAITGNTVYEGRLWFCTRTGNYQQHPIQLGESTRRAGVEVLEVIDRAIERGPLGARPARDACRWCDFKPVCGRDEESRTARKPVLSDLDALRKLP